MKKLLLICICAFCVFLLSSCSSEGEKAPVSDASESQSETEAASNTIDPKSIDVDTVQNTFNDDGLPLISVFRSDSGELTAFVIHEYDENGVKVRTTSYHKDLSVFEKVEFEYFDGGYYAISSQFDSEGKIIGEVKTEYDKDGKVVE